MKNLHCVTGANGYTGKYIAKKLLAQGKEVISLSNPRNRPDPFYGEVKFFPFHFDNYRLMIENFQEVDTLYNTYWIRFNLGRKTFQKVIENTQTMMRAALDSGVRRFIHISVSSPTQDSPLPYYRKKAELEELIKSSGLSYGILRPTVIFGKEDILLNNIAFLLRKLPVFVIPGDGRYQIQPIFVEDVAKLAVEAGSQNENIVWDAAGPETFTFNQLVNLIHTHVHSQAKIIHLPPRISMLLIRLIGQLLEDVVLTENELKGLMANHLVSDEEPKAETKFTDWLQKNPNILGNQYTSELDRHFRAAG